MIGAEADRVVYIGSGWLEAVSRARLSLGILLCCQNESRSGYNIANVGYRAAIEEGLVLVATLPSHPQVASNCFSKLSSPPDLKSFQISTLTNILSTTAPPPPASAAESDQQFSSWKGKGAAQMLLPDVEEENYSSSESSSDSDLDYSDSDSESDSQSLINWEGKGTAERPDVEKKTDVQEENSVTLLPKVTTSNRKGAAKTLLPDVEKGK